MMRAWKKKLGAVILACLTACSLATPAFAADTTKTSAETAFLRVKLSLLNEDGLSGISEDMITFSDTDKWTKEDDGYYYYADPLEDGDSVEFMKGLHIPEAWTKEDDAKTFRIVITAEVAENMDGTANWSDGSVTTSTSTLEYQSRTNGYRTYSTTELSVDINEYELDSAGNRIEYVNDKLVLPGTDVDKIVVLTIHIGSDSTVKDTGRSRDYDDDDDDSSSSSRYYNNGSSVVPIGGDGTEVVPIDNGTGPGGVQGIPGILTGDNSLMIPLAAAAILAFLVIILLVATRKKKKTEGTGIDE